MNSFTKKAGFTTNESPSSSVNNGYPRDSKDNKYFKEIQVKDVKSIITDDFVLYIDADSLCFKGSAVQDESYVIVKNISTGEEQEHSNKTAFKGRARGDSISQDSFLGRENLKLEAKGKDLLKVTDFEITGKKRLKKDGSLVKATSFVDDYIESIKFQTGIDNLKFLIGSGPVFRDELPLPEKYKGQRDKLERPILLKEVRKYLSDNYPCEYIDGEETSYEVDDIVSMRGFEGYLHYRKHGKFNMGQSGIDKDQWGTPSLIFNWDKNGVFYKLPQFALVEASDKTIGTIEMVGSDCKCSGLLQVCFQMCTQDSADNYAAYLKFPKEMHPKSAYSDAAFFKEFYPLENPKDCLQAVVDRFYEWFPHGLQYKDWRGDNVDCDTLAWIDTLFQCVYMKRKVNDPATFKGLCDKLGVDTGKVVNNNTMTAPRLTFNKETAENNVDILKELCENSLSGVGAYKSLKKGDLVAKLDLLKESLESQLNQFDKFYKLTQEEK